MNKTFFARQIKCNFGVWIFLLSFWVCIMLCGAEEAGGEYIPEELQNLYARSAVLMDGDSGRVLFGKNQEEVLPMASTTKIMTCILALELAEPEEICQVSGKAASQPKVHLGMKTGETYYLRDLLYSLMLESHNDTAVCIAEHVGGSVEGFAELMNQKAKEIGCEQAHFVTANGLDEDDAGGSHSISAKDLGLIMRYCIQTSDKREEFLEITRTAQYHFLDTAGKRSFSCTNHNALLTMLDGALTGKTGFTNKAGYCYVGAAQRGDETLIVVLLACGWPNNRNYKWSDTKKLMEYGFEHYEKKTLDVGTVKLPQITVKRGVEEQVGMHLGENMQRGKVQIGGEEEKEKLSVLAAPDQELEMEMMVASELDAPVKKGQSAGKLRVVLGEEILAEYPLICSEKVEKITYWYCLHQLLEKSFFKTAF